MQKRFLVFCLVLALLPAIGAQIPASCPGAPASCPASCASNSLSPEQIEEINSQDLVELCQSVAVRIPPQLCGQLEQQFGSADLRGCTRNFAQLLKGYSDMLSQVCEGATAAATNAFLGQYGTNCSEVSAYLQVAIEKMNAFPETDVLLHCDYQDSGQNTCTVMNDCSANGGFCVQYSLKETPNCRATDLCRNNILDPGEECQGTDYGGHSCEEKGMIGSVRCDPSCVLDWSGCSKPVATQLELSPSEDCVGETGITGTTGSVPRVSFNYSWSQAGSRCMVREIHHAGLFYDAEETIENKDFVFCDTTQATMDILALTVRISQQVYPKVAADPNAFLQNGSRIELPLTLYVALKSGFSPSVDFRRDFDYYQSSINFADTPSYYRSFMEQNPGFFLDPNRLVFEPSFIPEPGIYMVQSTLDASDLENFKVIFRLTKTQDPNPDSVLYHIPFEGAIGEQSPAGETVSRQGYGIGLNGTDGLVLNRRFSQLLKLTPVSSTFGNLTLSKRNSFEENNSSQRGKIMTINLQARTIEKTDSYPTPVLLEQQAGQEPVFAIRNPDNSTLRVPSYSNWNTLQTTASCDAVPLLGQDILDKAKENFSCPDGKVVDYAHTVTGNPQDGQTAFEGTVFYSPNDSFVLEGLCGTQFATADGDKQAISLSGGSDFSLQELMDGVRTKKVCISDDAANRQVTFFWNKRKLLSQLPTCDSCACSSNLVNPMLSAALVQESQLYEKQSQAFQVSVDSPRLLDPSHLSLWLKAPEADWQKTNQVLLDDGKHFDQVANDNVFGTVDSTGYSAPGTYEYRVELATEGQPVQQKKGDFQVFEPAVCSAIQSSESTPPIRINTFFLGQGYEFQEDAFAGAVSAEWSLLSDQVPEALQNSLFVYAVGSPGELSCDFEHAQTMTVRAQTINIVDCTGNLLAAVSKCNAQLRSDDSFIVVHDEAPYLVRTPGSFLLYLLGLAGGQGENPSIISSNVSFNPAFTGMPLQFYATVTNPGQVDPETQLELWLQSGGNEPVKADGIFYNDGQHFDGGPQDGIFSFVHTDFQDAGPYRFEIRLKEPGGNVMDQESSQFQIVPANACRLVFGPGSRGFFVNFFLLKEGMQGADGFYNSASALWETVKQNPKVMSMANFINVFALPTGQKLDCDPLSIRPGMPPSIACNSDAVKAALEECRQPLQMISQEQDMAMVLINGIPYQIRGFEGILNQLGEEP